MLFTLHDEGEIRVAEESFHAVWCEHRAIGILGDAAIHVVLKIDQDGHIYRSTCWRRDVL